MFLYFFSEGFFFFVLHFTSIKMIMDSYCPVPWGLLGEEEIIERQEGSARWSKLPDSAVCSNAGRDLTA